MSEYVLGAFFNQERIFFILIKDLLRLLKAGLKVLGNLRHTFLYHFILKVQFVADLFLDVNKWHKIFFELIKFIGSLNKPLKRF